MNLNEAVAEGDAVLQKATLDYKPVGVVGLFSGGNDSTVATHLSLRKLTHIAHINTGTGIPQTTEFVRQTAAQWGIPYIELVTPPAVYEWFLFDSKRGAGFPGGARGHNAVYWHLKQQRLRELRRRFVTNGRRQRVIFVTGIRAKESVRRMRRDLAVHVRREGSTVWVNPILNFDDRILGDYRQQNDVPRNLVSDLLHRSGECLCGAFAKSDELKEIEFWFPEVGQRIRSLEARLREAGITNWQWGGQGKKSTPLAPGPLCVGCTGT